MYEECENVGKKFFIYYACLNEWFGYSARTKLNRRSIKISCGLSCRFGTDYVNTGKSVEWKKNCLKQVYKHSLWLTIIQKRLNHFDHDHVDG